MKTIAMYLPQFHRIPENDQWWGEGFTDWVAVRNARCLYEGHHQPRVPRDNNYYDLLNKKTMLWQSELMHKYGIDGVCIYHYWFKDGRRVLEKPMENLLKWTDIDMPFCVCWANETWARSWSDIGIKNAWMSSDIAAKDRTGSGILLQQDYGSREQWVKHFEYLLPFFKDSRYIRVEGKPVIVLYRTTDIYCLEEMLKCWREMAHRNGFVDLYVIGSNVDMHSSYLLDGCLYHEPQAALITIREFYSLDSSHGMVFDYDKVWREILRKEPENEVQPFFEGFSGYDDSPRRGKSGMIVDGGTPEKFEEYLKKLYKKSSKVGADMIFINAWNEWGESMYLEPDSKEGYAYLEAVSNAKESWKNDISDNEEGTDYEYINSLRIFADRVNGNLIVLSQWMFLIEKGLSIADYIKNCVGERVAIYGWGVLGEHLYRQIKDKVSVAYIIDRNTAKIECDERLYQPEDNYPTDELLIITSVYYYAEIEKSMKEKGFIEIYSLDSIIKACINKTN